MKRRLQLRFFGEKGLVGLKECQEAQAKGECVEHRAGGHGKWRWAKVEAVSIFEQPDDANGVGLVFLDLGPGGKGWPEKGGS